MAFVIDWFVQVKIYCEFFFRCVLVGLYIFVGVTQLLFIKCIFFCYSSMNRCGSTFYLTITSISCKTNEKKNSLSLSLGYEIMAFIWGENSNDLFKSYFYGSIIVWIRALRHEIKNRIGCSKQKKTRFCGLKRYKIKKTREMKTKKQSNATNFRCNAHSRHIFINKIHSQKSSKNRM